MLCKKHPKAKMLRWSTALGDNVSYECEECANIRWGNDKVEEKRLDPPCDARAYAERYDFGNHDPERI